MVKFEQLLEEYNKLELFQTKEAFEKSKIEFVHYSNKLEGSNLTLIQTHEIIEFHSAKGEISIIDSLMAIDHYKALNQALIFGANKYPLTEKILLQLHQILLKNTFEVDPFYQNWKAQGQEPGMYKIKTNRILLQQNGVDTYFETPKPEESKELIVKSIEVYVNSSDDFILKLSKLIQNIYNAHAMFDGNKRLTRLVLANQLYANNLPLIVFSRNKNEYNEALIDGFINKNNNAIFKVLENTINQFLASEIENYKKTNKSNNKGIGFIL